MKVEFYLRNGVMFTADMEKIGKTSSALGGLEKITWTDAVLTGEQRTLLYVNVEMVAAIVSVFPPDRPEPPASTAEVDHEGMIADDCSWCQGHGYTPGQKLDHLGHPVDDAAPNAAAVALLDAIGDDASPESAHVLADNTLLQVVPAEVVAAYNRLQDRLPWWAAA